MGIFVVVCVLFFLACITFYKLLVVGIVKVLSFVPDFFVVFFYACYYTNEWIAKPYLSDVWVYIVNVLMAVIACIFYAALMILLVASLPKVGMVVNYIIVALGISVAINMVIGIVLVPIMSVAGHDWGGYKMLPFSNNATTNTILHCIICGLIAIPVTMKRVSYLTGQTASE